MFNEIFGKKNIGLALDALLQKNDTCGIDGMMTSELPEYMRNNSALLLEEIRSGEYQPKLVLEQTILGKNGKPRTITKLSSIDKLILRMIMQVLDKYIAPTFHEDSFAFQRDKSLVDAVKRAAVYMERGFGFVAEMDIEKCFDNIPHEGVLYALSRRRVDEKTLALIEKYLKCGVSEDFEIRTRACGLIQGSPLSPLLCNIYLHYADYGFENLDLHFVRYADDINLYADTYENALKALSAAREIIEDKLLLPINDDKCGVYPALTRHWLGYEFIGFSGGKIGVKKRDRKTRKKLNRWRSSALSEIGGNYHLVADGILVKKDFTLLFENQEKKMYLPIECTESISVYSDIIFSESFFAFMSEKNLPVNFFDKYGEYLGAFMPQKSMKSSTTLILQAMFYNDETTRTDLAKLIAVAAFHNIRENLRYYYRHIKDNELANSIESITKLMKEADSCNSVGDLLMVEARVRSIYYSCLNLILPDPDFEYDVRSKRPPRDALNALISFGNVVLYRRIASAIYRSRLDIRIGFLHATNRRPESLNLDIAEIFKPIIVDRVIFQTINKEMLDETLHFERVENGGIYLNATGKKIFLRAFGDKMRQRLTIDGQSLSYDDLIRREIFSIANHIDGKALYKPFKYFL